MTPSPEELNAATSATVEPLLSLNQARAVLGELKGVKRISYPALVRLVQKEDLPKVPNPFTNGSWAFQRSAILAWFAAKIHPETATSAKVLRGPGRPPKAA